MWSDRCGLFGSNAARVVGLCRTMEHGMAVAQPYLAARNERAEEWWCTGSAFLTATAVRSRPCTLLHRRSRLTVTTRRPHCSHLCTAARLVRARRDGRRDTRQHGARQHGAPVVDQPGRRWYVKDIRASLRPMGTQ